MEKRRVLFLYNEALKRRRGLFKYMTAQVKRKVREHKLEVSKILHSFIHSLYNCIKWMLNNQAVSPVHWNVLPVKQLNILQ